MNSAVHTDIKAKRIFILGTGATQVLNHALAAAAQYSINFTRPGQKFSLSLRYNGTNSFLFVNAAKIYDFEAKDSEMKKFPLCLGNISGDSSANNMKKNRIKWMCVRCTFDTSNNNSNSNIHKYLIKKHGIK